MVEDKINKIAKHLVCKRCKKNDFNCTAIQREVKIFRFSIYPKITKVKFKGRLLPVTKWH